MIPGTTVSTSALGYGCAALMARLGLTESVTLLEAAFDTGIRHYDVARSYGYGEAEKAVAKLAADRRDKITITTKFGILPPRRSAGLGLAKRAAKYLTALSPGFRSAIRKRAGSLVSQGNFSVADAQLSLETSLRELNTDYVDILLLHDCRISDIASDDLRMQLESWKEQGKIRQYGIATDPVQTQEFREHFPELTPIMQFADNVIDNNAGRFAGHQGLLITHSVLGEAVKRIHGCVMASPGTARHWSSTLDVDCTQLDELAHLAIRQARRANPDGIVLFSSIDANRIRSNFAIASREETNSRQLDAFMQLVDREVRGSAIVGEAVR